MQVGKIIAAFIVVLMSVTANAQTPASVLAAFKAKYPDVKDVKWSATDKKAYEADFESGATAYTATFTDDGKWVQTESGIENDDLPPAVKAKLAKEFDGYLITDAELVDTNDNGRLYNVHIERGEEALVLLLNEDGKILKRGKDDDEG